MSMKKPYKLYYMEKRVMGSLVKGTRKRVKGEIRREEYENIGYSITKVVEVKANEKSV